MFNHYQVKIYHQYCLHQGTKKKKKYKLGYTKPCNGMEIRIPWNLT